MKLNSELRKEARAALEGKWMMAALVMLVYLAISMVAGWIPLIGTIISVLVSLPMAYGLAVIMLESTRANKEINIGGLFDGFNDFGRIFGTTFLKGLYTFLWSLLLVVPGIIKGYSYAMTEFILKDEPSLRYNAAIEKSMQMMDGNKMRLFLLDLSFIGWALLSILTLGIGYLFLQPYMISSHAAFYEDLKSMQPAAEPASC